MKEILVVALAALGLAEVGADAPSVRRIVDGAVAKSRELDELRLGYRVVLHDNWQFFAFASQVYSVSVRHFFKDCLEVVGSS